MSPNRLLQECIETLLRFPWINIFVHSGLHSTCFMTTTLLTYYHSSFLSIFSTVQQVEIHLVLLLLLICQYINIQYILCDKLHTTGCLMISILLDKPLAVWTTDWYMSPAAAAAAADWQQHLCNTGGKLGGLPPLYTPNTCLSTCYTTATGRDTQASDVMRNRAETIKKPRTVSYVLYCSLWY